MNFKIIIDNINFIKIFYTLKCFLQKKNKVNKANTSYLL